MLAAIKQTQSNIDGILAAVTARDVAKAQTLIAAAKSAISTGSSVSSSLKDANAITTWNNLSSALTTATAKVTDLVNSIVASSNASIVTAQTALNQITTSVAKGDPAAAKDFGTRASDAAAAALATAKTSGSAAAIANAQAMVASISKATASIPPPADCKVSAWSAWGPCSKACGGGTNTRTRSVVSPAANGGAACPVLSETQPCNTQACPVDCKVSDWSAWTQCSKPCGGGTQTQTRTILVASANGGAVCPALINNQPCNTQACPVDCKVSEWSPWSTCDKACGGGAQKRSRTVLTPAANGGKACPANLSESQACNAQACPVDCKVSAWSPWSACDKPCGGGAQKRTRTVTTPAANGGASCPSLAETQPCNTQACPVDCKVSDWTSWTACSKTCGGGTQSRSRTVTAAAANGGKACPANLSESQTCNAQACPVNCAVSAWSACNKPCGGGTQTRTVTTPAANGGAACPVLTQPCNTQACPVDCKVSDWTPWSTCDKACGGGKQTRTRKVTTPAANGGAVCPANLFESQSCNTQACPVNCAVSAWSACNKPCGGGTQTRTVTTPAANGGTACPALTQPCNTQACPVNCAVSDWTTWSACNKPCGGGTQSRTRKVTTPAANGGTACPSLTESQTCNAQACVKPVLASNIPTLTGENGAVKVTFDMTKYQQTAASPLLGTLQWALKDQPAGVVIDPKTGVITVPAAAPAAKTMTLTVTGLGGSDSRPVTLAMTTRVTYPLATMKDNNVNGFVASASSAGGNQPFKAFNRDNSYGSWWESDAVYKDGASGPQNNGEYIGKATTVVSGTTVAGEWLQLQVPYPLTLTNYIIMPRGDSNYMLLRRNIGTWVLAGSNDGTKWDLIDKQTGVTWLGLPKANTYTPSNVTTAYKFFRIIVINVGNKGTTDHTTACIPTLTFNGRV